MCQALKFLLSLSDMNLQSVSNSERDVTVNLTKFEELLMTMAMAQKWGQIGG